ncbi:Tip elongation aberrant protein 1 [Leucoagaricus sp. SymC.cos]|nr:Tip elongation aberrant protein 1 [Leucoagaricus sp. SymC.cos]
MSDLADLADLVLSECQEPSEALVPIPGLWSFCRPILLPPSPFPGYPISRELSPPPFPRSTFGLASTENGDIYFCGGRNHEHPSLLYHYSTKDNTATVLQFRGDDPGPRYGHAMSMVGSSILALHGGDACESGVDADPSFFLFNLASRKWSRIPTSGDAPGSRHGHSMAVIGTTIFMFGGYSSQSSGYLNELWAFDLKTIRAQPRWELVTPSSIEKPSPRSFFVLVAYQNQLILFGGRGRKGAYMADTWSFNTNSKSWRQLQCVGEIPSRRAYVASAVLNNVMYVIGGHNGTTVTNDIFAYNISEYKWIKAEGTGAIECCHEQSAACIGTKIFVFGGRPSSLEDRIAVLDTKFVDIRIQKTSEFESRLARLEKSIWGTKRQELVEIILKSMFQANLLADLRGMDTQIMVDFLIEVLESRDLLHSDAERKHILRLLRRIVKSAHIFPRSTELRDVQCNLSDPVNSMGGYGLIYKGTLDDQKVCVKVIRVDGSGSPPEKIMRAQAGELALLGQVSHPNVIPLYGAYLSAERNPRICMVFPWMENGDLVDFLHKYPNTPKIPLMSDVAAGLLFLHHMGIVHADLKARNVLISRSRRAILTDFGVSTVLSTSVGSSTAADFSGTAYWMAPELLVAAELPPPTPQSDMWGFGCICFEAITGQTPLLEHYRYPIQLVGAFMRGGITPLRPKRNGPPVIADGGSLIVLAEKCWDYEPNKRLTAAEATQFFSELIVEDNRPSMNEELAVFEAVKSKRAVVKIDYDHLLSVLQK